MLGLLPLSLKETAEKISIRGFSCGKSYVPQLSWSETNTPLQLINRVALFDQNCPSRPKTAVLYTIYPVPLMRILRLRTICFLYLLGLASLTSSVSYSLQTILKFTHCPIKWLCKPLQVITHSLLRLTIGPYFTLVFKTAVRTTGKILETLRRFPS